MQSNTKIIELFKGHGRCESKIIKKFSCDSIIECIGRENINIFKKILHNENFIRINGDLNPWDYIKLCYFSINVSSDYRDNKIDKEEYRKIVNEFKLNINKIDSYFWNFNDIEDNLKALAILYGHSQEEFWYQNLTKLIQTYNRNKFIFENISKKRNEINNINKNSKNNIYIDEILYNEIGCDSYIFFCIIQALEFYVFKFATPIINMEDLKVILKEMNINIEDGILNNFLNYYTCDYKEIRDSKLIYNILYIKPFIRTNTNKLILLDINVLFKILSEGEYWIIRNYFFKLKSQKFTNEFGEYFEIYVKDLLKSYLNESQYYRADILNNSSDNKKISDWIISSKKYTIIIEQKSTIISKLAKHMYPNINILNQQVKFHATESYEQLNNTEKLLNNVNKIIKFVLIYDDCECTTLLEECIFNLRGRKKSDENTYIITIDAFEKLIYILGKNDNSFDDILDEMLEEREKNIPLGSRIDLELRLNKKNIINDFLVNKHNFYKENTQKILKK